MLPASDVRRLLFIKPSSLGDIVHAMPVLDLLRRHFAAARISWLVKREWAALVERIEGVDDVVTVGPGLGGWLGAVPGLRAARFDLAVDLQGLFRSGAMAWLSGAVRRIGFANAREGSPWFYSHRVAIPMVDMHAVDRYLLVTDDLGIERRTAPVFRFKSRPADEEAVETLLDRAGIKGGTRWIAMNVGARWPTKRWPVESFGELVTQIERGGLGPVVLFGGPGDREAAQGLSRAVERPPVNLIGQTGLGLVPSLLRRAAVLITNDSGPMHIAAAVGTPVVALFGPTSPARTGPYGTIHRVLRAGVSCSPCFSRRCANPNQLECLTAIAVSDVLNAVRQVLEQ